jgi:hypothetical protein
LGKADIDLSFLKYGIVNFFETVFGKEVSWNRMKKQTMRATGEYRELVPVIIAVIVAALGVFFLWSDLSSEAPGRDDGIITSAVVSRAGATATPSEPPAHLVAPQTVRAFEPSTTVGRATP